MAEYKFKDITEKIIGSSMKVHSALGNGFQEGVDQRAWEVDMEECGLHFARKLSIPIQIRADILAKEE